MTLGPIEDAYAAFIALLADNLVTQGVLSSVDDLAVDPASAIEPVDDGVAWSAAAVLSLSTGPVRTMMGGGHARYVVERQLRVELGASSADQDWVASTLQAGMTAASAIVTDAFSLGGAAERVALSGVEVDDIPPCGRKALISFVLRVRSGDPLGMTAP